MGEQARSIRLTRRQALASLGAAAAAAAPRHALAGPGAPAEEPDLRAVRVPVPVPATDPDSPAWARARPIEVAVIGQAMVLPSKTRPSVGALRARAVHDGRQIAFLLEWSDPRPETLSIKTDQFKDGCAVLLAPHPAPPLAWMMGTAEVAVTLLHWRADWQRDIDAGFQDLEVAFPNVAFDFYPPLVGAKHPPRLPDAYPPAARAWLPGWHVGNPLSQPAKRSPVEKLRAIGPGTVEQLPVQDASGRGRWRDGTWKVALARNLKAGGGPEVTLAPGETYAVAFAVWAGGERDVGGRKSVTRMGRLRL
jgi:hypothetical protein